MFDGLKLSRKRKTLTKLIEQLRYSEAFEFAIREIFGIGNKKSKSFVEKNKLAMFGLLVSCGMPEKQASRYDSEYYYILANDDTVSVRLGRYKELLKHRQELSEITEYEAVREKIEFTHRLEPMSQEVYNIKTLSNQLNHIEEILTEDVNDNVKTRTIREIREEILLNRFRAGQITFLDYDKSLHSLRGEKWFNYQIKIDEEGDRPDAFVLSFDFNDIFVKWLMKNGVVLTPYEAENVESDSDEYNELLVEKWAKSSLISLAATMLAEDGGETFRSVVATEPEGSIVEQLEIDHDNLEDYYGDELTKEQIEEIANKTRNRKMYR